MKLTKKQLLISGVCVLATCTLSFFAYKKIKKILEDNKVEIIDEEVVLQRQLKIAEEEFEERRQIREKSLEEWAQADLDEEEQTNKDELFLTEEDDREWNRFRRWSKEELETLRYDKNSPEALEQYKAMCLADVINDDSYKIMMMLFEIPFKSFNEKDNAGDNIQDKRYEFFGDDSVYSEEKTVAELFLYMASLLEFDLDYDTDRSIKMFIRNLGWSDIHPSDYELVDMCDKLMQFEYWSPVSGDFGIFGLADDERDDGTKMTLWIEQYWAYTAVELEINELEDYDDDFDPEEAYAECEEGDY